MRRAGWRSCRRWARSTPGISRWSMRPSGAPTRSPRRSSSIRPSSAPTRTSAAIRAARAEDARMLEEAGCDLLWMPSVADIYPDGFSTTVHVGGRVRALGRRGPAGPFRRRRDRRRQAAALGPARHRAVRREGFPAAGGDPADGRRPRHPGRDRRRADRARGGRPRSVLAQRLSSADERARAAALPRALEYARDAILDGTPSRRWCSRRHGKSLVEAGFSRIDYFALVDAATLEPLDAPAGEMRLIAAAVIGSTRLIDNLAV